MPLETLCRTCRWRHGATSVDLQDLYARYSSDPGSTQYQQADVVAAGSKRVGALSRPARSIVKRSSRKALPSSLPKIARWVAADQPDV